MADIDLKTETPDASINDSAVLFGADSQASASPSVYSVATVRSHFVGAGTLNVASGKTLTGSNTLTLAGTDATTMTFPATSGTVATLNTAQTFTALQTFNRSGEQLALGSAGANSGVMSFAGSTSGKVTVQAAAAAGTYTLTLPVNDGDSGQFLQTNGSGVTSWATASGGSGSPGGSTTQIQYNNAGSFGGMSGTAWNDTNRALTITGATVTADAPILNLTQTWNNSGVTFTGMRFNVPTDTSNAASLLMDLQVGGGSVASVRKDGRLTLSGQSSFAAAIVSTAAARTGSLLIGHNNGAGGSGCTFGDGTTTAVYGACGINGFITSSSQYYSFGASTLSSTPDLLLTRRGPANLRLGAADTTGTTAPTPQFLSAQSWASSTTNNQTGANFTIDGSQGTGTGAGGSIIFRVAPAGGTANGVQNGLVAALTIAGDRSVTIPGAVTFFSGTAGHSTITIPTGNIGGGYNSAISAGANNLVLQAGGVDALFTSGSVITLRSTTTFGFAATTDPKTASPDTIIARDAANTLALRNGTAAQEFRVYNTFTDASNYERLSVSYVSNEARLFVQNAGTGANNRNLFISTDGGSIAFGVSNTARWRINTSAHFVAEADNAYDIGAATANRPRNIFIAGYNQLSEMTAPAAPAANGVRIYAVDNGSGKTQLMALFATGAAQQIAIEP